ncbi:hypothetical protein [Enterococcus sp. HY326]|uniref:hypothetical protein n=1 Tax=Enterococcus sp. HY326 TaxID=2971265 RepID=UPI00223EF50B|nr:hypothetical protein [Enterococcus sp. HY326]
MKSTNESMVESSKKKSNLSLFLKRQTIPLLLLFLTVFAIIGITYFAMHSPEEAGKIAQKMEGEFDYYIDDQNNVIQGKPPFVLIVDLSQANEVQTLP